MSFSLFSFTLTEGTNTKTCIFATDTILHLESSVYLLSLKIIEIQR